MIIPTDSRPSLSKSLRNALHDDLSRAIRTIGIPAVLRMIGDIVEEKSHTVANDNIRREIQAVGDSLYQFARNIRSN